MSSFVDPGGHPAVENDRQAESTESRTVGVIGLGAMGFAAGENLIANGITVFGYDVRREVTERFADSGGRACASVSALADSVDVVLLSLPSAHAVLEIVADEGGILTGDRLRTIIDLSTCGPEAAREAAARAEASGRTYIDCPVSGGPAGARTGTLTLMIAGNSDVLDRNRALFEIIGQRIHRIGTEAGHAQTAKVINNMLSAVALLATSEALALGVKAGLRPDDLLEVINASSGRNTATSDKFPKYVLPGTFDFGFQLAHMRKDVSLCLDCARDLDVPMPLGATTREIWSLAAHELPADADSTAIAQLVEHWAGVKIRSDATGAGNVA
jgi:3-hydroxyisobutyrate dehydrogenase-like beta-hydroxyacid dehydrogenase